MRPLEDLKVIEVAENMCGPLCASYLGDLGADVVKVELPRGDRFRRGPDGLQLAFLSNNRSKRAVSIDFKTPAGVAVLRRLAEQADIFIDAARPGVADRRGYGWADLSALNSQLIYCTITGFGPDGPYSHKPSIGVVVQAVAGAFFLSGSEDGGPQRLGQPVECWSAVTMAIIGILSAIHMRDRGEPGQKVDVSVFNSLINTYGQRMLEFPLSGAKLRPRGTKHVWLAPHKTFKTADGYITVAVQEEERWPTFCQAIGKAEMAQDPRFAAYQDRLDNEKALYEILDPLFTTKTTDEWNALLEEANQYVGKVQTPEQLFADPQAIHNGIFVDVEHPDVPGLKMVNTGIRTSGAEVGINRRPPRIGERTIEVLSEWGFDRDEVDALVAEGVVHQGSEDDRVVTSTFGQASS